MCCEAIEMTDNDRKEMAEGHFRSDLVHLINKYNRETGSDTPDFILADYLIECLRNLDSAINARHKWYS